MHELLNWHLPYAFLALLLMAAPLPHLMVQ